MNTISIYVCYHKNFQGVGEIDKLIPIQVGTSLANKLPDKIYDNLGENISHLNKSYCELTALYWAWKNQESDYYGLFHYRRYLILLEDMINDYNGKTCKIPYKCYKYPDVKTLNKIGYADEEFVNIINNYDIIMPIPEDMHISVYSHYINSSNHNKQDIDLICSIIIEKFPQYKEAMKEYLDNSLCYFGNIFIAKKEIFNDYCLWLFEILNIYDKNKNVEKYSVQELRVDGYLAERLLGIYFTWLKSNKQIKWAEVPRAHFECMGNNKYIYYKKKALNIILKPGSKRRMVIKKIKNILG